MKQILPIALFSLLTAACTPLSTAPQATPEPQLSIGMTTLTGTAFYRERIALPPQTEMEVTLYDHTGQILAQQRDRARQGPPYRFSSMVPDGALSRPLFVEVRLLLNNNAIFSSDRTEISGSQQPTLLLQRPN